MNSEFLDEIERIYYDYELSTYLLINYGFIDRREFRSLF